MEAEPQDAARFDELSREDAELVHQIDVVQSSDSSDRVKKIRLRYIQEQMKKNLAELDALATKYEALKEKQMGDGRNGLGTGLTFEEVIELLKKEGEYAKGWGGKDGKRKESIVEGVDDHDVHAGTTGLRGSPFTLADWWIFTDKYWQEIPLAMSNYTPDGGSVRIRMIKVASMMIRALMIYGRPSDLERLAGVSSSKFPILHGGLSAFSNLSSEKGCLVPTPETGALRNEAPGCDPLKK